MFHVPFDVLGAVIYGTELVMWIGIMVCGLVLGRGEKEDTQQENLDLPQVSAPVASPSIRSRHSGVYRFDIWSLAHNQRLQVSVRGSRDTQYSTLLHCGRRWNHDIQWIDSNRALSVRVCKSGVFVNNVTKRSTTDNSHLSRAPNPP